MSDFESTREKIDVFNKENIYTGLSPKGYGFTCFANKAFKRRDIVAKGFGRKINHQTSHVSIQIDDNTHFIADKWSGKYWNHSCNPNTYIHTRPNGFPDLIALKNIRIGDEITFAYWMTEFEWSKECDENTIKCICGDRNCKNKILSFSQLSKSEQSKLKKLGLCSKYLLKH